MTENTVPTANPARLVYDMASIEKRLGSRISRKQMAAITGTEPKPDISPDVLGGYALSGDSDQLTDAQRLELRNFVTACKEHELMETASQKRRLWPRKVAAVLALS